MCVRCDCAKPLSSRRLLPIFIRRSFDAVFFALQGSFSAEAWRRCVKLLSEFLKLNPNYVSYNQLASPIAQTRSCRVSASFSLQKFSSELFHGSQGGGKGAGCAGLRKWIGHPHSRSPRGPVLGGLQSDAPFSGARGEDANCAAQCVFLRWNHSVLPAIFVLISCADVRRTCKQDWIGGECLDPSERGCVVLCCVVHSSLLSAPMLTLVLFPLRARLPATCLLFITHIANYRSLMKHT